MITLGIAATWIAISILGAKALALFARAVASSELEVEFDHLPTDATRRFRSESRSHADTAHG